MRIDKSDPWSPSNVIIVSAVLMFVYVVAALAVRASVMLRLLPIVLAVFGVVVVSVMLWSFVKQKEKSACQGTSQKEGPPESPGSSSSRSSSSSEAGSPPPS